MNSNLETEKKRFYLATVDVLQGISIFLMVVAHVMLWWAPLIDSRWPEITLLGFVIFGLGLLAHPCFFFIYGFNVVNSLLRKDESEHRETRHRLIKRTIIFLLVAEFCEGSAALVNSPEYLLNYLLTWELFHMFAFSTLVLLLVFEFTWQLDLKGYRNTKQVTSVILFSLLVLIVTIFLLIHDYENELAIQTYYVNLDINSIVQRAIFEYGQNPIIPFLSFPIVGGLLASILDLPHE